VRWLGPITASHNALGAMSASLCGYGTSRSSFSPMEIVRARSPSLSADRLVTIDGHGTLASVGLVLCTGFTVDMDKRCRSLGQRKSLGRYPHGGKLRMERIPTYQCRMPLPSTITGRGKSVLH